MSVRPPIPLYYRIYLDLKQKIIDQEWKPGQELPSETELKTRYGCARQTIRRALDGLVQDGVIVRKHGIGTFVAESQIVQPIGRIYSTSESIKARGETPQTSLISLETLPAGPFAERLELPDHVTSVYKLKRLRLANHTPIALMTTFIPTDLVPGFDKLVQEIDSLYEIFEREYGFHLAHANEVICASKLSPGDAKLLQCRPDDPALQVERTTYLDNGRVIEYMHELFRYDRFSISLRLEGRDGRPTAPTVERDPGLSTPSPAARS